MCRTPSLHADDLAVWSTADHTTSAAYRIQEALTRIQQWTDEGSSDQQNKDPSDSFLSSNSQGKDHSEAWRQNTTPSRNTNFVLGVKLDPRLSWKPQIDEMATKGIRKLAL